jgi:hypothetical protein
LDCFAGIRIARSVPLPGTAARVPIKQASDARLPWQRQSFPARSRRCQLTTLAAVFSGERLATLHAAKNERTTGNGQRDFSSA